MVYYVPFEVRALEERCWRGSWCKQAVELTWIWREQEELLGGRPLSVAVTTRLYSPLSDWLRGEEERRSPVLGSKVKRSALGPGGHKVRGSWGHLEIAQLFPHSLIPMQTIYRTLIMHRKSIIVTFIGYIG